MIRSAKLKELEAELPGYSLLLTYTAGLPVRELELDVRVLAKERISALQEYVMKCLARRISSIEAVDMVLGVGEDMVLHTLAYLHSLDLVDEGALPAPGGGVAYELTERGRQVLLDEAVRAPAVLSLPCVLDALTGELKRRKPRARLATLGAAATEALHAIPAQFSRPELEQLDKDDVGRVLRELKRGDPSRAWDGDLLDVLQISRCQDKYRIVDVAVFDDGAGRMLFRILDRGVRLREYEQILGAMVDTQPDVLPMEVVATIKRRPEAGGWLNPEEQQLARSNADALAQLGERIDAVTELLAPDTPEEVTEPDTMSTREQLEAARAEAERLRSEKEKLLADRDALQNQIEDGLCLIDTEEHRRLVERAFKHAKQQVVIVSPWLTSDAVDHDFKTWVCDALDRGVSVIIGWGYPDEGHPEHRKKTERSRIVADKLLEQARRPRTKKKDKNAAAGPSGRLRIVELGDTHEKILAADLNFAVVSSFNFLSYKGRKQIGQLGVRQERGYRIGIPEKVQEIVDDVIRRIEAAEQRIALKPPTSDAKEMQ